jgi:transposase-like protein
MKQSHRFSAVRPLPILVSLLLLLLPKAASAEDAPAKEKEEPRVVVATSQAPAGTLLSRASPEDAWQAVAPKSEVHSRDLLLAMPLSRTSVRSKNGAVELTFWGNLPQLSPLPILESAVVLNEPKAVDLDVSPDRGRVVLKNVRDKGAATVRVRLAASDWELTLAEPGTEIALELFGRWPRGATFNPDPKSAESPTRDLVLLVLQGSATLKAGAREHNLTAPPGPALFHWDSVAGNDAGPQRREAVPEWSTKKALESEPARRAQVILQGVAKKIADKKPAPEVITALMTEADEVADKELTAVMRRASVYGSAALDNVGFVVDALANRSADVRDTAVQALRHWIGRAHGQDLKLYNALQKDKKYPAGQAEIVLDLLHSYSATDLDRPETFEALIAYLRHDKPAIRELAAWHLYRLAPVGKAIAYDPTGTAESRETAYKKWKELIPTGQLPKDPKPDK